MSKVIFSFRIIYLYLQRSNEKMQFDCKILQKHLVPYL
ncbi:hypothetical protein PRO82_001432 [Candidatus Protochlamydia amoebophila]|nr:hypothetical protein [Candidatus Protochlamydia amoebophila]